jgi:hypothetical protein
MASLSKGQPLFFLFWRGRGGVGALARHVFPHRGDLRLMDGGTCRTPMSCASSSGSGETLGGVSGESPLADVGSKLPPRFYASCSVTVIETGAHVYAVRRPHWLEAELYVSEPLASKSRKVEFGIHERKRKGYMWGCVKMPPSK